MKFKATYIQVIIGSGNGLLLDCVKPIPEAMLIYYQRGFSGINRIAISHKMLIILIRNMSTEIAHVKLPSQRPRMTIQISSITSFKHYKIENVSF